MTSYGRVPAFDEPWGERFQQTMSTYMEGLEESVDAEPGDPAYDVETISGLPYDGCAVCVEREAYLMAIKLAIEGFEAGDVTLEDPP